MAAGNPMDARKIATAARLVIAQPSVAPQLAKILRSAPTPAQGVAEAVVFLMTALYRKSNDTMPLRAMVQAVTMNGGVLDDIAALGVASKFFALPKDWKKQALAATLALFKQKFGGQQAAAPATQAMPVAQPAGV